MNRKIVITDCEHCPHKSHRGAFGVIAYFPYCKHAQKDLPYSRYIIGTSTLAARVLPGIPDWCPLPEDANS
jgi:hypothetical protein